MDSTDLWSICRIVIFKIIWGVSVWNSIYFLQCRRELFHLQRELVRERTRKSVLEEQLKPINIHRWRHLEVRDMFSVVFVCELETLCLLVTEPFFLLGSVNVCLLSCKHSTPHYSKRIMLLTFWRWLLFAGKWPRQIWTHPEDYVLAKKTDCQNSRAWGTWTPFTGTHWHCLLKPVHSLYTLYLINWFCLWRNFFIKSYW